MTSSKMWLCMAALLSWLSMVAAAAGHGDSAIKVDWSRADAALSCHQVADQTQVYFDGRHAGFKPINLQVLLNGEQVPASQVHYAWPRVTLKGGLSPGRNTVELLAETKDGAEIDRSIVVKVGDSVHSADGVSLACHSSVVVTEAAPLEAPVTTVYEAPPTVIYPAPAYYGYPYYAYPYGYYGYPGGYYGYAGPAITLGFGGCFGCYRHGGWGRHWHGGGHRHWRH